MFARFRGEMHPGPDLLRAAHKLLVSFVIHRFPVPWNYRMSVPKLNLIMHIAESGTRQDSGYD
jgi:hypothetical protein